jgi:hypothetical protein
MLATTPNMGFERSSEFESLCKQPEKMELIEFVSVLIVIVILINEMDVGNHFLKILFPAGIRNRWQFSESAPPP